MEMADFTLTKNHYQTQLDKLYTEICIGLVT
jgi:hypothetical protein